MARSILDFGAQVVSALIRRIRDHEWPELRSFRLHALADAPTAYGSTLAQELTYTNDVWRERCHGASSGCDRATFIALREEIWAGTVTGLAVQTEPGDRAALLVAMFVTVSARRQGIARALVEELTAWAQDCKARQVSLWVASSNTAARSLYQDCGFYLTGKVKPHSHAPGLTEQEMARTLS